MAKVLVVGSRKDFDPVNFRDACRAIGRALAKHKHTIVAAGCGDDDAETWVLDGANSYAQKARKTKLIPFTPAIPDTKDLIELANIPSKWPNIELETPFQTKGPWAVGQAVALIRSDAAILIGGGLLTANVGLLALELDKPYYAVSALDGAAKGLAKLDSNKHHVLRMPQEYIDPRPNDSAFGENVVRAMEFLIASRTEKAALLKNAFILVVTLAILFAFLAFLFRDQSSANVPHLVYTTCAGALVGVLLSFLVGRVIDQKTVSAPELMGQIALASLLGVLYGFFVMEAGSFYGVEISKLATETVDSLALKMAMVGVGVGALLGPASKRVLEELAQKSKLNSD